MFDAAYDRVVLFRDTHKKVRGFVVKRSRHAEARRTAEARRQGTHGVPVPNRGRARRVRMLVYTTGYGPKYRGARMQPRTRGPEADETKTMTVTLPHRV